MTKTWCLVALAGVAAASRAEISYLVTALPETQTLRVKMTLPNAGSGSKFQIPNWAPGSYRLVDNFRNVKNLKATNEKGEVLEVKTEMTTISKPYQDSTGARKTVDNSVCTWVVPAAQTLTLEYELTLTSSSGAIHWSGPSTYLFETSRLKEKCALKIQSTNDWKAYTGLEETAANVFTAPDYDTLADNPVTMGDVLVDTYTARGKTHTIVMRGTAKTQVDRPRLIDICRRVSNDQTHFFGNHAPYSKYVWHFSVTDTADGGGGLEHLSSTQITLAKGVGPITTRVIAHEFFHLWNVKRIRSAPLGPFDYTQLPQTGALWWLEGVTDYYASTLLHRYRMSDEPAYYREIASNVGSVRRNTAHTEVSAYESSWRVGEASNGRGNSNGYRISYYDQGWVAGMVLDIKMRELTANQHSLDDVTRALWDLCEDGKPGFGEDEIRRQFVRFGGIAMGQVYDSVVLKPGKMMVEEALTSVGLQMAEVPEAYVDYGFQASGFGGNLSVGTVPEANASKLTRGDQILAVNGKAIEGTGGQARMAELTKALATIKAGEEFKLSVKRGEQTMEVTLKANAASRNVTRVTAVGSATPAQIKLREQWLAAAKS